MSDININQLKLMPHQIKGLSFFRNRRFALLNYAVGTGKTLIGVEATKHFKKPLLVRLSSHKDNWEEHLNPFKKERLLKGLSSVKCATHSLDTKEFNCTNYNQDFDLIVIDEVHLYKNPESKRTRNLFELIERNVNAKVLGLTGTPATVSYIDFYVYLKLNALLNRGKKSYMGFWEFKAKCFKRTLVKMGSRNFWDFGEMYEKVKPQFIKTLNEFMLSQSGQILNLPNKNFSVLNFEAQKKPEYQEFLEKDYSENLNDTTFYDRYEKLLNVNFSEFKKVIVLTKYIPSAKELSLDKLFYPVPMTGETLDREAHIKKFQNNKRYKFLVGTYKTLGIGHNLQFTNALVLFDYPYTPSDLTQGMGRIHRKGQDKICNYFALFEKTYDKKVVEKLFKRSANLSEVGVDYSTEFLDRVLN